MLPTNTYARMAKGCKKTVIKIILVRWFIFVNANITLIKVGLEHKRQDKSYKELGQWLSPKKDWPESLVFALHKNYFYSCVTSRRELELPGKDLQLPVPCSSWGLPEAASLSCQMQTGQEPREPSWLREKKKGRMGRRRKEGVRGKEGKREAGRKDGGKIKERRTAKRKKEICCYSTN